MSVRPVKVLPSSVVRNRFKEVLRIVNTEGQHVMLTRHGKGQACLISMRDARVLWQLQERPVQEMEAKLKAHYMRWLKAKRVEADGWEGLDLDDSRWVPFWAFEKM